jgi:hypothetical protein
VVREALSEACEELATIEAHLQEERSLTLKGLLPAPPLNQL